MAHFAKLDKNNVVIEINVVNNKEMLINGVESEQKGIDFLIHWSGGYTNWKQTSYNGSFRKRYAGIGYTYSVEHDSFIPPKPFNSWVLDTQTLNWEAPVPMPTPGAYKWNENTKSWDIDMQANVEVFK